MSNVVKSLVRGCKKAVDQSPQEHQKPQRQGCGLRREEGKSGMQEIGRGLRREDGKSGPCHHRVCGVEVGEMQKVLTEGHVRKDFYFLN